MIDEKLSSELERSERGKWKPATIGGRDGMLSLFADDMLTVEYGTDLYGSVERKDDVRSALASESGLELVRMLDASDIEITEWQSIDLGEDAVAFSYRVSIPSIDWTAYATSIWRRVNEGWKTVFYQASRAKIPS